MTHQTVSKTTESNSSLPHLEVLGVGLRDKGSRSTLNRVWRAVSNPRRIFSHMNRKRGYGRAWDHLGSDMSTAYRMVDTSRDEEELIRRGTAVAALLADVMSVEHDHTVLEIGCGPARIGRELASRCRRWVGADISKQMLSRARHRTAHLPNVDFQHLQGADFPMFENDSFDRVYCHSVLVHIDKEDMFKYLCEIKRLLKPGGLAYADTWNILHPDAWEWFAATVAHSPLTGRKEIWRPQFATTAEMRCMIEHAGLTEILVHDASHLLQAFVTVSPPEETAAKFVHEMRHRIEPLLSSITGLD